MSELYKHTSLCFSLWLRCITERTAWPAASEWTIMNQPLRRSAEGHGNPLSTVRAGGKMGRDSPAGGWHRKKPAGGGALSLRALLLWSFSPDAEPRGNLELPSHKENMSGSLSDPPPFSFFASLCTLSLPLSENWICCGPHHLFQGNSSYMDKPVPHHCHCWLKKFNQPFVVFTSLMSHFCKPLINPSPVGRNAEFAHVHVCHKHNQDIFVYVHLHDPSKMTKAFIVTKQH